MELHPCTSGSCYFEQVHLFRRRMAVQVTAIGRRPIRVTDGCVFIDDISSSMSESNPAEIAVGPLLVIILVPVIQRNHVDGRFFTGVDLPVSVSEPVAGARICGGGRRRIDPAHGSVQSQVSIGVRRSAGSAEGLWFRGTTPQIVFLLAGRI